MAFKVNSQVFSPVDGGVLKAPKMALTRNSRRKFGVTYTPLRLQKRVHIPRGGKAVIMGDESRKIDALFIDLDADAWRLL